MKKTPIFILSCFLCLLCVNLYAARYYVKPDGDDSSSGTTWLLAFATLTKAASVVREGDEVWAVQGTYQEGVEITIPQGVSFYGGFEGMETDLHQRDDNTSPTIIDGNNSHRCVVNHGVLNGFSVEQGATKSNGGGILNYGNVDYCKIFNNKADNSGGGLYNSLGSVSNCIVYNNNLSLTSLNRGGGIYNNEGEIDNCHVYGNLAYYGGGIYNHKGVVTTVILYKNRSSSIAGGIYNYGDLSKCHIYENISEEQGGGIYNWGTVENCIIYQNSASSEGGGIYNSGTINHCTVFKNSANKGSGIYNNSSGDVSNTISWKNPNGDIVGKGVTYCCYGGALKNDGNFSTDPLFANTTGDSLSWDFRLQNGSPCIDSGRLEESDFQDIGGNPRPGGDGKVCMGAYESPDEYFPDEPAAVTRYFVTSDGNADADGLSWDTPLNSIAIALEKAAVSPDNRMYEIWVAAGTFKENTALFIPPWVNIYGGFAGNESEHEQRNIILNQTIIDGGKVYYCAENYGSMDGFYITKGNMSGAYNHGVISFCYIYGNNPTGGDFVGGGVWNDGVVTNCLVFDNKCNDGGGIFNQLGLVSQSVIFNNCAQSGGGIKNSNKGKVINCLLYKNISYKTGGAIENNGTVLNCTIYANETRYLFGGGINGGTVINTISWKNKGGDIVNPSTISHCCYGESDFTDGNITADPLFVNTSGHSSLWDFHLQNGSACIDGGNSGDSPSLDLEGKVRPGVDGMVCMGAYESPDEYLTGAPPLAQRLYVNISGNENGDGSSWEEALNTISKALEMSFQNDNTFEIWVAKGIYQEGETLGVPASVKLFGGFFGIETQIGERNISINKTIVDGGEKHQCFINAGKIDGFYITRGYSEYYSGGGVLNAGELLNSQIYQNTCNGGSGGVSNLYGKLINCRIYSNVAGSSCSGGGIYNWGGQVIDCDIYGNSAGHDGGGISNYEGLIKNCRIYENEAGYFFNGGGGIHNSSGTVEGCLIYKNNCYWGAGVDNSGKLINCIIFQNNGTGIYNNGRVINCTVYRNSAEGISDDGTVINTISWKNAIGDIMGGNIYNCCYGGAIGEKGNFSSNPLFVNTTGDSSTWDFHLQNASLCIDAGKLEDAPQYDLEGAIRPGSDGKVCIGAYESPDGYLPGEVKIERIHVKETGNDNQDGFSWDAGLKTIKNALWKSFQDDGFYEIWVGKGTYIEGEKLTIPVGMAVLGGFSGFETSLDQRDIINNVSIVDGNDLYTCFLNYGILDGLYITNGIGDKGGGVFNYGDINRCRIYENNANYGGGIYNEKGRINDCIVYNNTGGKAGGIYSYYSSASVKGCEIFGNIAENSGGIYIWLGTVKNCRIYQNTSKSKGGGIWNYNGKVTQCELYDNSAQKGGGIYLEHGSSSPGFPTIHNSNIYNNSATVGGGIFNPSHGFVENCNVYSNHADENGGGIYNEGGVVENCSIYNNDSLLNGGGIYTYSGYVRNSISWDNLAEDIYIYGALVLYSCYSESSGSDGNISSDPLFMNSSGDISLWDFHLQENSPCIDMGDPNYTDGSRPPGLGSERADMGSYGGPMNYLWNIKYYPNNLIVITPYGDVWGADCKGLPPLENPYRRGWLGFHFNPVNKWFPMIGNVDGNEGDDLIQITEFGDAWVSVMENHVMKEPRRWGWLGFHYDEKEGYHGWLPLCGDANGDGRDDLIQVTEYDDAWVSINTEISYKTYTFGAPNRWGRLEYRFNRAASGQNGALPLSGDVNGDGLCDLIQVTEYTDAWAALSTGSQFETPTRWGWLGFKYAPFDGWYPLCGDVNADGRDDLVQITPTGDPWVSLSNGSSFDAPTRWGWLGFYYNEEQGHYPMLGDVNSDGMEDLIQITPEGMVWVAVSLGDSFDTPEYWGSPGFPFSRENGYMPFFLDF